MVLTALLALAFAGQVAPDAETSAAPRSALDLLEAISAEPRIVGTPGYDRAIAIIEEELRAAGLDVQRLSVESTRAVPHRSDVLLFEDAIAETAFTGLRERWAPGSVPTAPLPAAYEWNSAEADVRAPIVDCGEGRDEDYETLDGYGVSAAGAVALVTCERAPAARRVTVRELASRAKAAGCVAVLVAPLDTPPVGGSTGGATPDDFVLEDTAVDASWSELQERLALPVAPIRSAEAAAIRERLRAKRVRDADGRGTTVRLGPGPIEARVTIDCPLEVVRDVALLRCTWLPTVGALASTLLVDVDARTGQPLAGATSLAAAVLAARSDPPGRDRPAAQRPEEYVGARFEFGPSHYEHEFGQHSSGGNEWEPALRASLAPASLLSQPGRLIPVIDESPERLSARLGGELPLRLGAAGDWIAHSLHSLANGDTDPVEVPAVLRAPLPEER